MNSYVFLDDAGEPYVQQFFSDSLANPLYFVRPQRWASFLARMCDNCLDKHVQGDLLVVETQLKRAQEQDAARRQVLCSR
jgi:hypothetical protein